MPHIRPGRNAYRQIRVTMTEETGGRFSVRLMVKPVSAQWTLRHVVHHRTFRMSDPPDTLAGVLGLLADELRGLAGGEPSP